MALALRLKGCVFNPEPEHPVVAACAYCKSFIAVREPFDDPSVTHGACDPCVDRMLREWEALTGLSAEEPATPAARVFVARPATAAAEYAG